MNGPGNVAPSVRASVFRLPNGERVMVRTIRPRDAPGLQTYLRGLSGETRRNRFLGAVSELPPAQLERLSCMSRPGEMALLGFADIGGELHIVAEAILVMAPNSQRGEIALSVADPWQGRGLGTLLLQNLECRARMIGARYLFGDVLRTNSAMKNLARRAGFAIRSPFTDARLIEIVKDLSVPESDEACREQFAQGVSIEDRVGNDVGSSNCTIPLSQNFLFHADLSAADGAGVIG
jgi:GNAT superfamily N-acetyltransferase